MSRLNEYLKDPLLRELYEQIRSAGPIRSVSMDITSACNLRCKGCYYFQEGMDRHADADEQALQAWIAREKQRGTNFVTVVGGEPSLALPKLALLQRHFRINVATNGLAKIPMQGFERLAIGIAVWGNRETDSALRANGRRDLFDEALRNYRNDPRAFWYYTVAPGHANEVESVVQQCIDNGNRVLFNYYSDLAGLRGGLDHRRGFDQVRREIDRMIDKHPTKILTTTYLNEVVSTGQMTGMTWGYDVCTNVSTDADVNRARLQNGKPFNVHFRAYNADLTSTRRCCTGIQRSCESCFDTWEHFSWIMVHMRSHLRTKEDFAHWLFVTHVFYVLGGFVDLDDEQRGAVLARMHGWGRQARAA